jgi:uncharacterized protein (DUF1330 family)
MKAYLVLDIDIVDAAAYKEYVGNAPPYVAKHGGRYLVRGGNPVNVEGEWPCTRLAILEFPDRGHLQAFLDDPDYAPWKALRLQSTRSRTLVADGYSP